MAERKSPEPSRAGRFAWREGALGYSQCIDCRHKHRTGATCTAFPDGILEAILTNDHDHRQPFNGDHGVFFEAEGDLP